MIIGVTLGIVVWTDSLVNYVRTWMTVPVLVAAVVLTGLGLASLAGRVVQTHVPRSVSLIVIPVALLLVVQPGPISVDSGLAFNGFGGGSFTTSFQIPDSARVGPDASAEQIAANAVDIDPDQFLFDIGQAPLQYTDVALRMTGQIDQGDSARLVRFRIICCAADAVSTAVQLTATNLPGMGTWVVVTGEWNGDDVNPGLVVATIETIDQPANPYLN